VIAIAEVFSNSKEEVIAKQLEALISSNPKAVKMLTDIENNAEAQTFAVFFVIAERYKLSWLKNVLGESLLLRVSKNRLREKAIVDIAKAQYQELIEENEGIKAKIKSLFS